MAENWLIIPTCIGQKLILCGLFKATGISGRKIGLTGRPKID